MPVYHSPTDAGGVGIRACEVLAYEDLARAVRSEPHWTVRVTAVACWVEPAAPETVMV
jgi:hypothetical protein